MAFTVNIDNTTISFPFILAIVIDIEDVYAFVISSVTRQSFYLQVIPHQLCDNAGFDATDVLNKLRQKHASGELLDFLKHRN